MTNNANNPKEVHNDLNVILSSEKWRTLPLISLQTSSSLVINLVNFFAKDFSLHYEFIVPYFLNIGYIVGGRRDLNPEYLFYKL